MNRWIKAYLALLLIWMVASVVVTLLNLFLWKSEVVEAVYNIATGCFNIVNAVVLTIMYFYVYRRSVSSLKKDYADLAKTYTELKEKHGIDLPLPKPYAADSRFGFVYLVGIGVNVFLAGRFLLW